MLFSLYMGFLANEAYVVVYEPKLSFIISISLIPLMLLVLLKDLKEERDGLIEERFNVWIFLEERRGRTGVIFSDHHIWVFEKR